MAKNTSEWKPTKRQLNEYKMLQQRADKRLQRLESAADKPFYHIGITNPNFAYKKVMKKLEKYGKNTKGNYRFGKAPETRGEIKQKIAEMKWFLGLKTSTKSGITAQYKKSAATLNKNYDTNFTWKQWATLWGSGARSAGGADAIAGSDSFVKAMAHVKMKIEEIKLKEFDANNIYLYRDFDEKHLKWNLNAMLNDSSIPWDDIFYKKE